MHIFLCHTFKGRFSLWNYFFCILVLSFLIFTPGLLAQATTQDWQIVQMEQQGQAELGPKLGYGNCQWLYPAEKAQEKLFEEPEYKSKQPVYYAAKYGNAADNIFTFVIDESKGNGQGYDVVYIDANNDNRLEQAECHHFNMSTTSKEIPLRASISIGAGEVFAPYYLSFTAFPYSDENNPAEKIHANLRNSSYYAGKAVLFGEEYSIALADLDSNGLFNDTELGIFKGDRFFVDLNHDGNFRQQGSSVESFSYGEYTLIKDQWFSIVASPDGSQVKIKLANPVLGRVEAPPYVTLADFRSTSQAQALEFADNVAWGVEGLYSVKYIVLTEKVSAGFELSGVFQDNGPSIQISKGKSARIIGGYPLAVRALAEAKDEQGTIEISLSIMGAGGEVYRWRQRNSQSPKAGFVITKPDGEIVHQDEFEYG